ncbi:kinetochore protein Nuf2 [Microplitis demolitor]|uniref:kinetochore protein Nuf2 n=1 Tax=Microplitis demolitor TaxID=69319 RepID=UPI0004CDA352|nr:kinetochore protein Nuf2 [Microplitis demolitor]
MDFSPESVHSLLTELEFPVSMEDLKNPTESFMIKFITELFQRFHIDVGTLTQLAFDQVDVLKVTGEQNASHIVCLLNLAEVIGIIGEKIFVKDFSVTDITSPGSKRTRKILKFLANFTLYAQNASAKLQEETDKIFAEAEQIENTKKRTEDIKERMNSRAAEMAIMIAQTEAMDKKAEEIRGRLKKRQENIDKVCKQNAKLQIKTSKLEEIAKNKYIDVKKLESTVEQLKTKIVADPNQDQLRLQELEKEREDKEEKRIASEEAIQQKKPMIQHFEKLLLFIAQLHSKLPDTFKFQKRLMEESKRFEVLDRQLQELKEAISVEEKLFHENDEALLQEEIKKYEAEHESNLVKLRNTQTKLINEKKILEEKIADMKTQQLEFLSELDKVKIKIAESENKTKEFLKQSQDLCNEDIRDFVKERLDYVAQLEALVHQADPESPV